jgi:two-component system, NtrC family, response regulator HydG
MSGSRLALVTDDQQLANAIQACLKKNLGQNASEYPLATVAQHLPCDSDTLLLLAIAAKSDADQAIRAVQEICLLKLAPIVLLVEAEFAAQTAPFDRLDPYLVRKLHWPADADKLVQLIRERVGRFRGPMNAAPESIEDIIGRRLLRQTPSLLPLVERLALAAQHDVTVLLTGETGTGKTYLARIMHDCSPRQRAPFLTVPCGALPASLVEAAFFGHEKGAFTGADRAKVGKFEAAASGTILLDEIDTLGLEQQAGLLRVIETGEFEPIGSNETRRCHARIIVASNWDLEEAVQNSKFRQDLYYRLNVMSFHLPPLRDRVQDIEPLVRGMAAKYTEKFRKDLFDIGSRALEALETYPWPGNIRQLENFMQQAVLVSSGPELLFEHLPQQVRDYQPLPRPTLTAVQEDQTTLCHSRETIERNVILRALDKNGYSRARAALALGISRVTLYKKMKKYGLMQTPAAPSDS